jgi:Txe/YoeB family toxin of Txe-Axe toxin-antitoxin module
MKDEYKIVFSAEALLDLKEAKFWYEHQNKGLGKKLVNDVKMLINKISANPYFASVRFENIRTPFCKIFPYSVHYEIDEAEKLCRTISIFHHSRRPYWKDLNMNE